MAKEAPSLPQRSRSKRNEVPVDDENSKQDQRASRSARALKQKKMNRLIWTFSTIFTLACLGLAFYFWKQGAKTHSDAALLQAYFKVINASSEASFGEESVQSAMGSKLKPEIKKTILTFQNLARPGQSVAQEAPQQEVFLKQLISQEFSSQHLYIQEVREIFEDFRQQRKSKLPEGLETLLVEAPLAISRVEILSKLTHELRGNYPDEFVKQVEVWTKKWGGKYKNYIPSKSNIIELTDAKGRLEKENSDRYRNYLKHKALYGILNNAETLGGYQEILEMYQEEDNYQELQQFVPQFVQAESQRIAALSEAFLADMRQKAQIEYNSALKLYQGKKHKKTTSLAAYIKHYENYYKTISDFAQELGLAEQEEVVKRLEEIKGNLESFQVIS